MGRSVSTPSGATVVAYAAFECCRYSCGICGEFFDEPDINDDGLDVCPECGSEDVFYRDQQMEFQGSRDYFVSRLTAAFPSVTACDEWVGREDHAVADNSHAYFGISEYCGLVAMWVLPKEVDLYYADSAWQGLRNAWCKSIERKFRSIAGDCFGQALRRQGSFSNGVNVFQPIDGRPRGAMGLGYTSREGWL